MPNFNTPPQAGEYISYNPSLQVKSSKLGLGKALVRMSAVWCLVGT